jgi:tetratricopeptide (TPR) repeat protein
MPQRTTEDIDHSSLTDHRILRTPSQLPVDLPESEGAPASDLLLDTKHSRPREAQQDLRNLALAYAQVVPRFPELRERSLALLDQAVAALPSDPELASAYGRTLAIARPADTDKAIHAFQKAIDLGSQSAELRAQLARVLLQKGEVTAAIPLYKQSLVLDPYLAPAYLDLAQIYATLHDRKSALEMLDRAISLDPGNAAARQQRRKIAAMPGDNP